MATGRALARSHCRSLGGHRTSQGTAISPRACPFGKDRWAQIRAAGGRLGIWFGWGRRERLRGANGWKGDHQHRQPTANSLEDRDGRVVWRHGTHRQNPSSIIGRHVDHMGDTLRAHRPQWRFCAMIGVATMNAILGSVLRLCIRPLSGRLSSLETDLGPGA